MTWGVCPLRADGRLGDRVWGCLAPAIAVQYVPVDTLGCVEVVDVHWPVEPVTNEVTSFSATYRVRPPGRISRSGAEAVVRAICRHLVTGRSLLVGEDSDIPTAPAAQAPESAMPNEGFFHGIAPWLSNERSARQTAARAGTAETQQAVHRMAALANALERIASTPRPACRDALSIERLPIAITPGNHNLSSHGGKIPTLQARQPARTIREPLNLWG